MYLPKFLFAAFAVFSLFVTGVSSAAEAPSARSLVESYFKVQKALTADDLAAAVTTSSALRGLVVQWLESRAAGDPERTNLQKMEKGCVAMAAAREDSEFRTAFGELSKGMIPFLKDDLTLQKDWQLFFCPMTSDYGYWVQPKGESLRNPYYGKSMLECGVKKSWKVIPIT